MTDLLEGRIVWLTASISAVMLCFYCWYYYIISSLNRALGMIDQKAIMLLSYYTLLHKKTIIWIPLDLFLTFASD